MRNFSLPRWSTIVDTALDTTFGTHRRATRAYKNVSTEPAPPPKINRIKMHGFGITKYSLFTPFGHKVKTTYQELKRLWPKRADGNAETPAGNGIEPEYDPRYFAPVRVRVAPKLVEQMRLLRSDRYQSDLLRQCRITFTDGANIAPSLARELGRCSRKLSFHVADEKSARLPLLLGLRRACSDVAELTGEPVSDQNVARALAYLRQQNLFASVLNPPLRSDMMRLDKEERIARDLAWRLIYKLSTTENGMTLLFQITHTPASPVSEPMNDTEKNRQRRQYLNLKHFFRTANNLLDQYTRIRPTPKPLTADPSSLLKYCCAGCEAETLPPNTLILHGLPGIQQVMCEEEHEQPQSFWQKRMESTVAEFHSNEAKQQQIDTLRVHHDLFDKKRVNQLEVEIAAERARISRQRLRQQAAITDRFAYKWVSDGHYSNAPGSFLHTANERFKKIETHLKRREMRHARSRTEAFFKRTREIITAKNRTFVPASGVVAAQHNPDSMLLHREVMQSMLYLTEEMLLRDRRLHNDSRSRKAASGYELEAGPHRPVLQNIARLAMIRQWQDKPLHYLSNDLAPTEFEIDKLLTSDSLRQLFGKNPLLVGSRRDELIAAFRQAIPTEALTPELLAEWVADIELDPSVPIAQRRKLLRGRKHASLSSDQLQEKFAESVAHLQQGHTSSLALTGEPVQDFKNAIADEIAQMRLGNVRTFAGGTTHGVYVPLFSELISMVKSFGMVRLVLNGNYSHRSLANFEVGIPSSGGYIRFTGSHEDESNVGLGVTLGPKSPIGADHSGFYVTAAAEGGRSVNRARGIALSLPRGGTAMTGRDGIKPGVNGDAEVARQLADISRIVTDTDESPPLPNDPFPAMRKLRRIYDVAPDISVSMIQDGDSRSRENNGGGRAGIQLGLTDESKNYGLTMNATLNANYARRRTRFRQRHGALDVEVMYRGVRKSVGFLARLPVMVGVSKEHGSYYEDNQGHKNVSRLAGSPFAAFSVNAELWKSGIAHQTTRIIYDGKISKNCYKNIFYLNAKQFTDAAEKNITAWANCAAAHDPDCPPLPTSMDSDEDREKAARAHEIRRGLVAKHAEGIQKYLARVKETAHQSNVYFDFLELTPEATDKLNHYYQREIELRAAGCIAEADACKKLFDALWDNDDAWAPYFLVTSRPQQSNSGASVNLGLTFADEQPTTSNTFLDYYG